MIESLTGWWELAGCDIAVGDMPIDWLAIDAKPEQNTDAPVAMAAAAVVPAELKAEWPQDLASLRAMIANGTALPGNDFSNRPVVPAGPNNCEIAIVTDMPDADELTAGILGSGASGALLVRILAAIGVDLAACYWTALATTITPEGELPDFALAECAAFVRHQIDLTGANMVIVLGSAACRALIEMDLMDARGSLRNVNHLGGKKAAMITFHPRTLLARPMMKAQAWKDLRMFAKKEFL